MHSARAWEDDEAVFSSARGWDMGEEYMPCSDDEIVYSKPRNRAWEDDEGVFSSAPMWDNEESCDDTFDYDEFGFLDEIVYSKPRAALGIIPSHVSGHGYKIGPI